MTSCTDWFRAKRKDGKLWIFVKPMPFPKKEMQHYARSPQWRRCDVIVISQCHDGVTEDVVRSVAFRLSYNAIDDVTSDCVVTSRFWLLMKLLSFEDGLNKSETLYFQNLEQRLSTSLGNCSILVGTRLGQQKQFLPPSERTNSFETS
jgi:hypothetical protein